MTNGLRESHYSEEMERDEDTVVQRRLTPLPMHLAALLEHERELERTPGSVRTVLDTRMSALLQASRPPPPPEVADGRALAPSEVSLLLVLALVAVLLLGTAVWYVA